MSPGHGVIGSPQLWVFAASDASSAARADAATIPSLIAEGTPRCSITFQPASVVPFGVATMRKSCMGSRPSIRSSSAVPFIVWRASLYATSRGSPDLAPPSIIAWARAPMNPGPLPLRPVTASSIRSSTIVTRPIAPKISSMVRASCSVAVLPSAKAVAPSPTAQGRFGMIRTTRPRPARTFSTNAVLTPAASVMTRLSRLMCVAIPSTRAAMSFGFAARKRTLDFAASSPIDSVCPTPCFAATSLARDGTASLTRIRVAGTTRPTRSPRTRASPIFPTPAMPIISCPSIGPPPPRPGTLHVWPARRGSADRTSRGYLNLGRGDSWRYSERLHARVTHESSILYKWRSDIGFDRDERRRAVRGSDRPSRQEAEPRRMRRSDHVHGCGPGRRPRRDDDVRHFSESAGLVLRRRDRPRPARIPRVRTRPSPLFRWICDDGLHGPPERRGRSPVRGRRHRPRSRSGRRPSQVPGRPSRETPPDRGAQTKEGRDWNPRSRSGDPALHVQAGPPAGSPLHASGSRPRNGLAGHPREARKGAGVRAPGRLAACVPYHHGCKGAGFELPSDHQRSPDPAHTRHPRCLCRCYRDGPRGGRGLSQHHRDVARRARWKNRTGPHEVRRPNDRDTGPRATTAHSRHAPCQRTARTVFETERSHRIPPEDATRCAGRRGDHHGELAGLPARSVARSRLGGGHCDRMGLRQLPTRLAQTHDDRGGARRERIRGDAPHAPRRVRLPGGNVSHDRVREGACPDATSGRSAQPVGGRVHDAEVILAPGPPEHLSFKQTSGIATAGLRDGRRRPRRKERSTNRRRGDAPQSCVHGGEVFGPEPLARPRAIGGGDRGRRREFHPGPSRRRRPPRAGHRTVWRDSSTDPRGLHARAAGRRLRVGRDSPAACPRMTREGILRVSVMARGAEVAKPGPTRQT